MGVFDIDVLISSHLKELAWAVNKWLWVTILFLKSKNTKELKNKTVLNLKQYCIHCYVAINNIF